MSEPYTPSVAPNSALLIGHNELVSDVGQISDFRTLLSTLSPDALTRGKQFERVTKWWLENDPIHSRQIEKVWLWDEWPEYPGRDIGVDLVARLIDGSLMAVQAKCVDESRSIPKSELDSFVSAASSSTFKHKMLVATTDGLSANAQRMLADQHVVRVMLCDLETSVDIWPSSIDHLDQHPVQPKATPRPHQQQAISGVTTGMRDHDRGQLIMACGTGKTLTALWITEQLKPEVTLVLVPSLNLLSQTLSEWSKNTTTDWSYLCVCSDDTVNKSDDQPISTIDELPFEVTTNPDDIAHFLKHSGTRIIFSTYQSSARVAQAQQLTGTTFDLVICDEAHRLTGKTDADYATVLDNSKIVAEKRLFMTATPRTYTPAAKSKAEDRGVEITSMDDETVYGPVLHKLSFGEAIKQELLSDYRVLIVGVTDPQVQDLIDRRELVSVNDTVTTDARTLAAHIGLAKATKDYNLKRTISFHSRIKSADQFAQDHIKILEWLPETHKPEGTTWTGTISGAMNTGERRRLLSQLKQDDQDRHALLTNARCLTEGVDVPSLDGVAFIDPRSSQVDIIQAVGRAIRKSANKEIGTIVLPVLIPTDADAEHALEDTAFKPIWAILNALKSHDEELAVELNTLRTELGRTGAVRDLPDRIVEDLPIDIDSLLPGFLSKLSIAVIENSTESWEWWYGLLIKYVESHGTSRINSNDKFLGYRLGAWVASQRSNNNKVATGRGNLDSDRWLLLDRLPNWTWDPVDDYWEEMYEALGTTLRVMSFDKITHDYRDSMGRKLGAWVISQRVRRKRRTLKPDQELRLQMLPGWSWQPIQDRWSEMYRRTAEFLSEDPTSRIKDPTRDRELQVIRSWIVSQRVLFKNDQLSSSESKMLESIPGWTWDPVDEAWNAAFNILKEYKERNNGSDPSKNTVVSEFGIGQWLGRQRQHWKSGSLSQAKIERLDALGVHWKINAGHGEFFDSFISHLKTWVSQGGEPNPQQIRNGQSPMMADGYKISEQATQARRAIAGRVKNVSPTQHHLDQLEALGFEFKIMRKKKLRDFENVYRCIDFDSPISQKTFNEYPIDEIATSSRLSVGCICPTCGYKWEVVIRFLTGASIPCPNCRLKLPDPKGALNPLEKHENWPFIKTYWDFEKNEAAGIDPGKIGQGSTRFNAYLVCPDCHSEWRRVVSVLRRSFACPECMNANSRFRPEVIEEIHRLFRDSIPLSQISKRFGIRPNVLSRILESQVDI